LWAWLAVGLAQLDIDSSSLEASAARGKTSFKRQDMSADDADPINEGVASK
jgi:hypothetical protein